MSRVKPDPDNLTPQQHRVLVQIAAGYPNTEVARSHDVTVKTIENWRKLPKFKELLREALSACFDAAVAELVLHSQSAAKELNFIIKDPDTPSRVRVSAITALLTFASKAKDAHLETRLEQLEKLLAHEPVISQIEATRDYFPEETEETE